MKTWEDFFGKFQEVNESIDSDIELEELLSDYEIFNPVAFINYLDDNGYKIIKK